MGAVYNENAAAGLDEAEARLAAGAPEMLEAEVEAANAEPRLEARAPEDAEHDEEMEYRRQRREAMRALSLDTSRLKEIANGVMEQFIGEATWVEQTERIGFLARQGRARDEARVLERAQAQAEWRSEGAAEAEAEARAQAQAEPRHHQGWQARADQGHQGWQARSNQAWGEAWGAGWEGRAAEAWEARAQPPPAQAEEAAASSLGYPCGATKNSPQARSKAS